MKKCKDRSPDDTGALLPVKLLEFFKKRPSLGSYIPLTVHGKEDLSISYCEVAGANTDESEDIHDIPTKKRSLDMIFDDEDDEAPLEIPFTNLDVKSKMLADDISKQVIRAIYDDGNHIDSIKKAYMIASTLPIKVNFSKSGKKSRKAVFVKRPSQNRILGLFIYNMVSGAEPTRFAFNDLILVEEEVSGTILSVMDESKLLRLDAYKEGILRASVQLDFLQLAYDAAKKNNRIVGEGYMTKFFDFDNLFVPKTDNYKYSKYNYIINKYFNHMDTSSDKALDVIFDEQYRILRRVEENPRLFFEFVRIAGSLVSYGGMTIDQIVRNYYGATSLEAYYTQKLEDYKLQSPFRTDR